MSPSPAVQVHRLLLERGETVAVAESLTGGLVGAALTSVPGASSTFRGAVVAYATQLKAELLGVDEGLLAAVGPVSAQVAVAMAEGVRRGLGATYGLATTGVAGPDPQDGHPPGEVHVAAAVPRPGGGEPVSREVRLMGDRAAVRAGAVAAALELLLDVLQGRSGAGTPDPGPGEQRR